MPSLVEIGPVFLEEKIFKFCQCIFSISFLSPLGKGQGPLLEQTWIPFTQGSITPSLVEIGSVVLKIFKLRKCVFAISNHLPLEKGGALFLSKLESPSPKDALCQVWLKLTQWFWRRFLNFVNVFSLFRNYLPLEKGGVLHLNKLESPSTNDVFFQVLLKFGPVVLEEKFLNFVNVFSLFYNHLPLEKSRTLH